MGKNDKGGKDPKHEKRRTRKERKPPKQRRKNIKAKQRRKNWREWREPAFYDHPDLSNNHPNQQMLDCEKNDQNSDKFGCDNNPGCDIKASQPYRLNNPIVTPIPETESCLTNESIDCASPPNIAARPHKNPPTDPTTNLPQNPQLTDTPVECASPPNPSAQSQKIEVAPLTHPKTQFSEMSADEGRSLTNRVRTSLTKPDIELDPSKQVTTRPNKRPTKKVKDPKNHKFSKSKIKRKWKEIDKSENGTFKLITVIDYGILVTTRPKKVTIKPQERAQIKNDF